jgi:ketosteroid isomerase-like protein
MIQGMHATTKDMKMEVLKELADDDYVFAMARFRGTSTGGPMPAGPYDMHAAEVIKFKNGKAVEHWEYMDPGEMMKMMQKMQGPQMNTAQKGADTGMAGHH